MLCGLVTKLNWTETCTCMVFAKIGRAYLHVRRLWYRGAWKNKTKYESGWDIKIQICKSTYKLCWASCTNLLLNLVFLRWPHLPRPDRRPDTPATRWATRFLTWPKCENLVAQSGRLEQSGRPMKLASVQIYLRGPDICPKGSSSLLIWSAIWSPRSDQVTWTNLVAQEPSGRPSGCRSIWSSIWSW